MKEAAQEESKTRRRRALGIAIRTAFGIWVLAGMAWAVVVAGDLFQIGKGSRPAVATDDMGNQVVVFQAADGGIRGRLRDSRGRTVGIELEVSSDPEASKPEVAFLRSGGFLVAWENGDDEPAIVARRFNSKGRSVGIELLIGDDGRDPAIGVDDRDVLVAAWTTPADAGANKFLHAVRRFDRNGRTVGIERLIGQRGPATPAALAVQEAGRFLVVFEDQRGDIVAQAFDVDGAPLVDVFRVNESRAGSQASPDVTVALDGDYTVVWERALPGSGGRQVYGRRISALGRTVGIEFLVSETSSELPTSPAIMADERGNTVVTWVSHEDNQSCVLAREVTLDSRAVGIEFLVDSGTSAVSSRVSRGGRTGDFVVVWDADDGEASSCIFGRDLMAGSSD